MAHARRLSCRLLIIAVTLAPLGCAESDSMPGSDAARPRDGGDGGVSTDGGTSDGATPLDAARPLDAATPPDSGRADTGADAGRDGSAATDAMMTTDSSVAPDAGADAAAADSMVDAGPLPSGLVIAELHINPTSSDDGREWVKLYNGGGSTNDLAGYSLGGGGTNYLYSVVQLAGTVPAGGCFVVGGPTSDAENGSPVFHQSVAFVPPFQNAGTTADGVALFAVPAASITTATVPIDAVIYGGANTSGLMDETGAAGAVDADDPGPGNSLTLIGAGQWIETPTATPSVCPPY